MEKTDRVLGIIGVAIMIGLPVAATASRVAIDPNTPLAVWMVLGFIFDLAALIHLRVETEPIRPYPDSIYLDYVGDYTGQT
ncbi:MAG: hypothetical protein HYW15_00675 [Candidatus Giovannonibacteria bacterium]|nr:MAG: hypothetical protein HYW15_00675 [Candidatus Giovannonibacteria bacterium]